MVVLQVDIYNGLNCMCSKRNLMSDPDLDCTMLESTANAHVYACKVVKVKIILFLQISFD